MKVKLCIGSTSFITTATNAAKVAELLGEMIFISSKYWSNEERVGRDYHNPNYKNGTVEFVAPQTNKLVSMEQCETGVFRDEAQADEWVREQIEAAPESSVTVLRKDEA